MMVPFFMLKSAQLGQLFGEKLAWTSRLGEGNIAGSRAFPAPPSAAQVIPSEGYFSL
jgi:hypothetical protein